MPRWLVPGLVLGVKGYGEGTASYFCLGMAFFLLFFLLFFFFCLHFLFPMRVVLGECNENKNRQKSALPHKRLLGNLHASQLSATPKGTTRLLRLQVGDVSSLSPHPDVAGGGWAPLVAEGGPQVRWVPTG